MIHLVLLISQERIGLQSWDRSQIKDLCLRFPDLVTPFSQTDFGDDGLCGADESLAPTNHWRQREDIGYTPEFQPKAIRGTAPGTFGEWMMEDDGGRRRVRL